MQTPSKLTVLDKYHEEEERFLRRRRRSRKSDRGGFTNVDANVDTDEDTGFKYVGSFSRTHSVVL